MKNLKVFSTVRDREAAAAGPAGGGQGVPARAQLPPPPSDSLACRSVPHRERGHGGWAGLRRQPYGPLALHEPGPGLRER